MAIWISYGEASRHSGLKEFLFDTAISYGLDLQILDTDKGWFRMTVYFSVSGSEQQIKGFQQAIQQAVIEYNQQFEDKRSK